MLFSDDASNVFSLFRGPDPSSRAAFIVRRLITGPALEPVSLSDAKLWLRVDHVQEDDLISALITSARLIVEAETRRLLMTQTWRLTLDQWPRELTLKLPLSPCQGVVAIRVLDEAGVAQTLAASSYVLDMEPQATRLRFASQPPQPGVAMAGIEIDVLAGYGDTPGSVPEPLRQAIRQLVARWYENRGDVASDMAQGHLIGPVAALIAPFRSVGI